jgi:hypothetical protein
MPRLTLVVRGRFQPLDVPLRRDGPNVWTVLLPKAHPIHAQSRRAPTLDGWDGAIFALDGIEVDPAIGSGETATALELTLLAR